ncbi:Transcription initiation factor TFIID component TAF4, partial [Sesbania bispinosa]
MKLLEDDEDETMHSGVDVEAFQAALNRDIGGDALLLNFGFRHRTDSQNQEPKTAVQQEQPSSEMELKQHGSLVEQLQHVASQDNSGKDPVLNNEVVKTHNPNSESQYAKLQQMSNQQASVTEQPSNQNNRSKQVPFGLLLPILIPQLAKDRAMQLQTLFTKLKKDEIAKDSFVRLMKGIVGDQMLRLALAKVQMQSQTRPNQGPAGPQHPVRMPTVSSGARQLNDPHTIAQMHQRSMSATADQSRMSSSAVQAVESNARKSQELDVKIESQGLQPNQFPSSSAVSQKQKDHQFTYKGLISSSNNIYTFHQHMENSFNDPKRLAGGSLCTSVNNTAPQQTSNAWQPSTNKEQNLGSLSSDSYVKKEPSDLSAEQQNRHNLSKLHGLPSVNSAQIEQGSANQGTVKDEFSRGLPASTSVPPTTSTGLLPLNSTSPSVMTQLDPNVSSSAQNPSNASGVIARTTLKKPPLAQKKPLESLSSSPPPSKKQKMSGGSVEQSIEQLNDVTAVSGVDLREEEEQLFSGPKEDSRVSEALAKCGLKGMSNDVERCLSLCVEERMRGLISNLIRLSKQRVDFEKTSHRTVVTSDVRRQIITINRKLREEWEKKQAETEKLRKSNDVESNTGVDGDKEKDESRTKSTKVNKEEDDKTRMNALNVAARAAFGGDDMFSKWQLMAKQARQKREGGVDVSSGSQPAKDVNRKSITSGRNTKDNQGEKKGPTTFLQLQ